MLGSSYDTFFTDIGRVWTWFSSQISSFLQSLQSYDLIFRNVLYLSIIGFILSWILYVFIGFQFSDNSNYSYSNFKNNDSHSVKIFGSKKYFRLPVISGLSYKLGKRKDNELKVNMMEHFKRLDETNYYYKVHPDRLPTKLDKFNFKFSRMPLWAKIALFPAYVIKNRSRIKSGLSSKKDKIKSKLSAAKSRLSSLKDKVVDYFSD